MEKYKNLKKGTKVGLIISAILLAAVLVNDVFSVVKTFSIGQIPGGIASIIDAVMCVIILLYVFFGYKKPHGNMLKFVYFMFAISLALQGTLEIASNGHYAIGDLCVLAALLIAYVAGRLHKIEKNKFTLILVGLLILAKTIVVFLTSPIPFVFLIIFGQITPIITFATLCFAYTARYEEHKAAGLEDKQDA